MRILNLKDSDSLQLMVVLHSLRTGQHSAVVAVVVAVVDVAVQVVVDIAVGIVVDSHLELVVLVLVLLVPVEDFLDLLVDFVRI